MTIVNTIYYIVMDKFNHIIIANLLIDLNPDVHRQIFNATDISSITFSVILPPKLLGKNSTNSQNKSGTSYEIRNVKVCAIKILLDSGASASIVRKNVVYERHKILKDKKNKRSTMTGTFNTTFVTEIILKLPELNHSAEIYAKCHLTNKILFMI